MNTRITKHMVTGWKALTTLPLGTSDEKGRPRELHITTYKSNGLHSLTTSAKVVAVEDNFVVHAMGYGTGGGDYSAIRRSTSSRCTEKNVTTQHNDALKDIETIKANALAHYAARTA